MGLAGRIQAAWFRKGLAVFLWPFLPLSWLHRFVVGLRRRLYRAGLLKAERVPVPVVVVGNLIVGGAGKTPVVLWLVEHLRAAGRRPGIVSRGYGGRSGLSAVPAGSDPAAVGDEPALLAARSGVPVFVGRRRADAAKALLAAHPEVDLIVCDDGLQHLALARDVDIVVVDGRGFGNGHLLPAGPLREPAERIDAADAVVHNFQFSGAHAARHFSMALEPGPFYRLDAPSRRCSAADLAGRPLFAIAGIGHPGRFFETLRALGLEFEGRAFPDHHPYRPDDLSFAAGGVLLMTEKDAIKCRAFLTAEAWVLPVTAKIEPDLAALVLEKIDGRQAA